MVQESVARLRLRVVPSLLLTAAHRAALTAALYAALGHRFAVAVGEQLARSPAGKLEEFVSLVNAVGNAAVSAADRHRDGPGSRGE